MIGTLQKTYASARSIAEGIKVNKTFTKLTLNFDDISDAGATFIAVAIKVNKTLDQFTFVYNDISDASATFIA